MDQKAASFLICILLLSPGVMVQEEGAYSLTLTDLAFEFTRHVNLHLVSSRLSGDMENLSSSYYTSYHPNQTTHVPSNVSLTRGTFPLPRNLVRMESVNATMRTLLEMRRTDADSTPEDPIVVVWPQVVGTEGDVQTLLRSPSLSDATSGFDIGTSLFFLIPKGPMAPNIHASFHLFEVYHINGLQIVQDLRDGVVDFACVNCKGVVLRRSNFYGISLNVSAFEEPEASDDLHIERTKAGDLVLSPDGLSARILTILMESLNFTTRILSATDWGKYVPENKSWVGAVKDVADGKADLGISMTTMRPARGKLVSFLPAADHNEISAFFLPPNLNSVRDIFARPFHVDLWAAVFSTWIVLAFFMSFFSIIRARYKIHEDPDNPEPDFLHDSLIWALATACQQGWDEHPVAGSLRTIFISGSFTGVVAYAGYSAAIVSTLSLKVDPIQNPDQLVKSSLHVGIRTGFIRELLTQNGTEDIMTAFQRKLMTSSGEKERYLNIESGYAHLKATPYAFISTRDNFYDYLKVNANDSDICLLKDVQILQKGFPLGHFVNKDSPYKEFLRYVYVTIREPGVSWKLRSNYTYKRRCLEASDNSGNALGANDVFTAFMILVGGYVLSLTFVAVEKLYKRSQSFAYMK